MQRQKDLSSNQSLPARQGGQDRTVTVYLNQEG
jgi:hypothetical protein